MLEVSAATAVPWLFGSAIVLAGCAVLALVLRRRVRAWIGRPMPAPRTARGWAHEQCATRPSAASRAGQVPDPQCPPRGGGHGPCHGVCRSDWHAGRAMTRQCTCRTSGPRVRGRRSAGGSGGHPLRARRRVTAPFILSCGRCAQCSPGAPGVPAQRPGSPPRLMGRGGRGHRADHNLVALPDGIDMTLVPGSAAASAPRTTPCAARPRWSRGAGGGVRLRRSRARLRARRAPPGPTSAVDVAPHPGRRRGARRDRGAAGAGRCRGCAADRRQGPVSLDALARPHRAGRPAQAPRPPRQVGCCWARMRTRPCPWAG